MELTEFILRAMREAGREQVLPRSEPDRVRLLENLAGEVSRQGKGLDLQELPEKAEKQYRLALAIWEKLLEHRKNPDYARQAEEVCLCLADLSMQQGNMHGADVYYVKAMEYGKYPRI